MAQAARIIFAAPADAVDARLRFGDAGSSGGGGDDPTPQPVVQPLHAACRSLWQAARRAPAVAARAAFQPSAVLQRPARHCWQHGSRRSAPHRAPWVQRAATGTAQRHCWQQGAPQRAAHAALWQAMLALRAAQRHWWQQCVPQRAAARLPWWQQGAPQHAAQRHFWQQAMRATCGGRSTNPWEGSGGEPPCYDPATLGRLEFWQPYEAPLTRLVFICRRAQQGSSGIVVAPQRYYIVLNEIDITLADGTPLPCEAFSMVLDDGSWTWSFAAAFKRDALPALLPAAGSDAAPVRLTATINGQPFALIAESVQRSVRFPERLIRVNGRGLAALLDSPHAPQLSFTHDAQRTAHQLALDALTLNGVPMGWGLDWQLADWSVPAGVWVHQGTWASALADIAQAAGGWLLPADNEERIAVLPRWPLPWWRWGEAQPNITLPAGIAEVEETAWEDLPAYERIFVSGEGTGGILGDYKRAGTAGALLAPQVVHPLITDEVAARQRATAELCRAGRMVTQTLTLQVLPATGIIHPGQMLHYTDDGGTARLGIVRSCSIAWSFPALTQTIGVQSHAA